MQAFTRIEAVAVPVEGTDIDTDQILPARFMHKARTDYGRYCFHDHRFDPSGAPRPAFVLNQPAYGGAQILVGDRNFGCGSSREQAVHTLVDFGIRCVIAPSFGDIFQTNCLKNGVLPVVLPDAVAQDLRHALAAVPGTRIGVDLEHLHVTAPSGAQHPFTVDAFGRSCLLSGLDEIDYTLTLLEHLQAFEAAHR